MQGQKFYNPVGESFDQDNPREQSFEAEEDETPRKKPRVISQAPLPGASLCLVCLFPALT
jgi:hypothetical protein